MRHINIYQTLMEIHTIYNYILINVTGISVNLRCQVKEACYESAEPKQGYIINRGLKNKKTTLRILSILETLQLIGPLFFLAKSKIIRSVVRI